MKIKINEHVERALTAAKINVAKLLAALSAAYHEKTEVSKEPGDTKERITGMRANETKGTFEARESEGRIRRGKLTDPLRFLAWNHAFQSFIDKNGAPAGEITIDVLPASKREWIVKTFHCNAKSKKQRKAEKRAVKAMELLTDAKRATVPGNGTHAAPVEVK